MNKVLISIHPKYVSKIFNGEKNYEFRKILFKQPEIKTLVIYSTSPVMKVVGEVELVDIIIDTPEKIWERTKTEAGIGKSFFDKYYASKKKAVALQIGRRNLFDTPKALKDYGLTTPPQSFAYIR